MGFIDRLLGPEKEQQRSAPYSSHIASLEERDAPVASFDIEGEGKWPKQRAEVQIGDEIFSYLQVEKSEDDKLFAFYHHGPVFVFTSDQELLSVIEQPLIAAAGIANDGTVVLGTYTPSEPNGVLRVVSDGETVFERNFEANVQSVAITPDGQYVAASVTGSEFATYLFDVESGNCALKNETIGGVNGGLEFREEDGETLLYLYKHRETKPFCAFTLDGDIAWRSERMRLVERKQRILDGDHSFDRDELIVELKELIYLFEDERESKPLARLLADAHWQLASELKQKDGVTTECWNQLAEAYTYYRRTLPWSDGKKGVAKVRRLQGNTYLKRGEDEMARQMFQEIADLQEEYGTKLMTDADKKKLEQVSA